MKIKILKKVLAVILSASMILGTGIVALADDEPREIPWVWQKTADGHRGSFTSFETGETLYTQHGGSEYVATPVKFVSHEYNEGSICSVCGYERADESSCSGGHYINSDGIEYVCEDAGHFYITACGNESCGAVLYSTDRGTWSETRPTEAQYAQHNVTDVRWSTYNGLNGHMKRANCSVCGLTMYSNDGSEWTSIQSHVTPLAHDFSESDECTVCHAQKPAPKPAPVETKEETKKENTVTVTPSVVATPASVTPTTLSITPSVENALVKASSNATPVFINMTTASVIPETIVEKLSVTNASVNLTISKSTLNGTVAAPIVVKTVEPKGIGSLLETTVNIPKDKKLIVMSPVKGATTSNTAVIYQNYGAEMAGKVVNFYVADPTGKFRLYTSAVVYPNGYAAFVVPVVGFVGYAE